MRVISEQLRKMAGVAALALTLAGCAKLSLEEQLKGLSPVDEILTRIKYVVEEVSLYDEEIARKHLNTSYGKLWLIGVSGRGTLQVNEKKACIDKVHIYKYLGMPAEEEFNGPSIDYHVSPEYREQFVKEFNARPKRPGAATAWITYDNVGKYDVKILFSYGDSLCVEDIIITQTKR
jgi:hypothetical protein